MDNHGDAKTFLKGTPFEIDTRLLITIVGMIIILLVSLSTRASKEEVSALRERTSVLEVKLQSICDSQRRIESTLDAVSSDQKKILQRVSTVEGKSQ